MGNETEGGCWAAAPRGNESPSTNNDMIDTVATGVNAKRLALAKQYCDAGLSLVPIHANGTKHPACNWKQYMTERAPWQVVSIWVNRGYGLAAVTGGVSENYEVIDFDDESMFDPWRDKLIRSGYSDLLDRLTVIRTPRPGYHVTFRCLGTVSGSMRLAMQPDSDDPKRPVVAIETRGEGAYCILPGSPSGCHSSNRKYEVIQGDSANPPVVTCDEREVMFRFARELNRWIPQPKDDCSTRPTHDRDTNGNRPGDVFNAEGDWHDILEEHGWNAIYDRDGVTYWRRPDKDGPGCSATTNYAGIDLLYVFSTNAEPFESECSYSKFAAYTLLNHDGNYGAAAGQLLEDGYSLRSENASEQELEEALKALRMAFETCSAEAFINAAEVLAILPVSDVGEKLDECSRTGGFDASPVRKALRTARFKRRNSEAGAKPVIVINGRDIECVVQDSVNALVKANVPPVIFVQGGNLVRLRHSGETPIIDQATPDIVRLRLAQCALPVERRRSGTVVVPPPLELARNIVALGEWSFPELKGIIHCPALRPDSSIISDPGYDPTTGLFYAPASNLELPQIPEIPSVDDVKNAREIVDDILWDFPYMDQADRANAYAMLLTPILLPMIGGCIPLAIVNATQPGSGKGLFVDSVSIIATGAQASIMTEPESNPEWRKQITTQLSSGNTFVVIDNVENHIGDPSLAAVLTAASWSDRLLGTNTCVRLPASVVWIATGNNVQTAGDIPRRCYWVRLNPQTSYPERRTGFRHDPLLQYIEENRGSILAAMLTIARAWFAAGQPQHSVPVMGSFQPWATIVGSILTHAGIDGFLGNADEQREAANAEGEESVALLFALYQRYDSRSFTVQDICATLKDPCFSGGLEDFLTEYLATQHAKNEGNFPVILGKFFRRIANRRFGESCIYIEACGKTGNRQQWHVLIGGAKSV